MNGTNQDVKIVEVVNRKPCCGEIRVGNALLHPGDETQVEVTLAVRQEFGDIVHETVVLTEPPQSDELVLRTSVRAYPAVRVEEAVLTDASILLTSDQPRRVVLRVFAYGSTKQPPFRLDHVEPRSSVKVEWEGPEEATSSNDGLKVGSRRLVATLDPAAKVGERKDEILLLDSDRVVYRHTLNWEVVPPITSSPKMIVLRAGNNHFRLVVQSRDNSLFRITRVEISVPRISGCRDDGAAALTHSVVLEGTDVRREGDGRGFVTVFTDHPLQSKVELPLVVLE